MMVIEMSLFKSLAMKYEMHGIIPVKKQKTGVREMAVVMPISFTLRLLTIIIAKTGMAIIPIKSNLIVQIVTLRMLMMY
jgi:hypothetical protein